MKNLFAVDISDLVYVLAEDEKEAEKIAKNNFCKFNLFYDVNIVCPPNYYHAPDQDWLNCPPYSGDNSNKLTCGEIIEQMKKEEELKKLKEEAEKKQMKFSFYDEVKNVNF